MKEKIYGELLGIRHWWKVGEPKIYTEEIRRFGKIERNGHLAPKPKPKFIRGVKKPSTEYTYIPKDLGDGARHRELELYSIYMGDAELRFAASSFNKFKERVDDKGIATWNKTAMGRLINDIKREKAFKEWGV